MPEPIFIRRVTVGDILTMVAGVCVAGGMVAAISVWKGATDAKVDNLREMVASTHGDVRDLGSKVDRVAETVASLDGKISAMGVIKKADGVPGFIATPIVVSPQ